MPDKLKEKHRGSKSELIAAIWLLDQGFEVFRNVSQHGVIDLVAIREGEIFLFDVKTQLAFYGEAPILSGNRKLSEEQIRLGVKILLVYPDTKGCQIVNGH